MERVARLGWLVVGLLVAAGCSAGATTPDDTPSGGAAPTPSTQVRVIRPGGTLTVDVAAETDSFNPFVGQWSVPSYVVANAIFEPLASIDAQGIARPYLAESILPTGDFLSWTITARPDVTFQDGEPFDAAALKKNLDTARSSGLTAQVFTNITSVEVISDRAVTVTMARPWATFPATLAMQSGYMAAPAMLDDPAGANAAPIGTGPFTAQLRQRDAYLKTTKNKSYWRTDAKGNRLPYLDAIDFNVVPDASSRANALAAGQVDASDFETPDALRAQTDDAGKGKVQLISNNGTETDETILALNTSREPFDDPIARKALALGVDQDKLAATAYRDTFPGAWGMFEPDSPYFISKKEAGYPDPDPSQAKQLADQYRQAHGKPLEFTMLLPPDPQYLAIAQTLQAQLKDVGITVDLKGIEQTQLIRTVVATGDYQSAGFLLRSAPTPDQSYIFLATKANKDGLSLNFTRLDDPTLTSAMDAFRAAGDPKTRIDSIKTVQKELAANLPIIFLVHSRAGLATQPAVQGLHATTYPGTDKETFAPYANTPFYTFAWKDQ
jgi:peptide/nickel transport system substrate-binding protein